MNSLDALFELLRSVEARAAGLARFHPRLYSERLDGRSVAELGGEPILHMRELGRSGRLSDALVTDVLGRRGAA
jgi:hypothetical protein